MPEHKNDNRAREVEQNLINVSRLTDEQLFEKYRTEPEGLNQVEAAERLEEYGRNIIDISNENSLLSQIKDAVINPFNIVLMIVALVTLFTDVILSDKPNPATFIMLVMVILISGVISFAQSAKSDNAARKLQKMIANRIDVIRNGIVMEIDIDEAVPGDIVKLASGDMIPGDVRFIESKDLLLNKEWV